jgi:hypothetical protein
MAKARIKLWRSIKNNPNETRRSYPNETRRSFSYTIITKILLLTVLLLFAQFKML